MKDSVSPEVVLRLRPALGAGEQVAVVASFDRNVFDNAGFEVTVIDADILDEAGTLEVTNGS